MRFLPITCAVAGAGFLSGGCASDSPSNEPVNSSSAEASRTVVERPNAAPGVIDCIGAPTERPASLSLKCSDDSRVLVDIQWTEWSATEANGTGFIEAKGEDGAIYRSEEVPVELSSPLDTPQGRAFTRLTVAGQPEQP